MTVNEIAEDEELRGASRGDQSGRRTEERRGGGRDQRGELNKENYVFLSH